VDKPIVTAFDVGTTHLTVLVGRQEVVPGRAGNDGGISVLGATSVPCTGMRKGAMVSLEAVTNAIHDALDEIERQTGLEIGEVRVATASAKAVVDNGVEEVALRSGEVRASDVERVAAQARSQRPHAGHDVVHLLPGDFVVDGKAGVLNPVGMFGQKLVLGHHRVQLPSLELKNLLRAFNTAGLKVSQFAYEPLTAAQGVLTADERELGVLSVNFGASLTHLALFAGRVPVHCRDLPIASHHVTKDLAIGLRTTLVEAERLKREYGLGAPGGAGAFDPVEVQTLDNSLAGGALSGGGRVATRQEIGRIVEARVREMLGEVAAEVRRQKLSGVLGKGVVLSGGGALLNGLVPLAESILGLPCRLGLPLQPTGITESLRTPSAATAFGLLAPVFAAVQAPPAFLAGVTPESTGLLKRSKSLLSRLASPFG
jgi:cell division protein FtsA